MAVQPISISVDSAALIGYLKEVPGAIARGMGAAAVRAGKSFLTFHKRERLSATKVSSRGKLFGTKKGFLSNARFFVTGDTIETSTLSMVMRGGSAKIHETGGILSGRGRLLPVPMPRAKDPATGKVTNKAKKLLRESRAVMNARSVGVQLHRGLFQNLKDNAKRIRGFSKVTSRKTGKQYLAIFNPGKRGREKYTYWFHLEKQVRVKPRLEFVKTWEKFEPRAIAIYRQALPYAIKAAKAKLGRSFAPKLLTGGTEAGESFVENIMRQVGVA